MSNQDSHQLELTSAAGDIPVPNAAEATPGGNQAPQPKPPGVNGAKATDLSLDPQETVRKMVGVVQAGREQNRSSEDIVASLLRLAEGKNKLVFIRFDLLEIYKIWTAKLAGKDRIS